MPILALTLDLDDTLWPVLPALQRADQAVDGWLQQHHPDVARTWPITAMRELRGRVAAERLDLAHDFTSQRRLTLQQAFAACGIEPARIFVVDAAEARDRWWAAEQVLRADGAGALLFWPGVLDDQRLRRLQLAAQDSDTLAFLFAGTAGAAQASPSPLRLRLAAEQGLLRIDVFKRRGGVMSQPLLLDVSPGSAAGGGPQTALALAGVPAAFERPATRKLSFKPRYAVGGPAALIWNRALARADEGRRGSRPDPRESGPRGRAPDDGVERSGHFASV